MAGPLTSTIHHLREQVAEWCAEHHGEQLAELIRTWIGPQEPNEDNIHQGVAFALLFAPSGRRTLLSHYLDVHPDHSHRERLVLDGWRNATLAVLRVDQVELDRGLHVFDVVNEQSLFIREQQATHTAAPGMWLLACICRMDQNWEFDAAILEIPVPARIHVVRALLDEGNPIAAVEAWHRAVRKPRFQNTDGHDVTLTEVVLDLDWEALVDLVADWPDATIDEAVHVFRPEPVADIGGPPVIASFSADPDGVVLFANSEQRIDEMLERLSATQPIQVRKRETSEVPSDPEGPVLVVDSTVTALEKGQTPEMRAQSYVMEQRLDWLDLPIPALDGLTPRQAVEAGRRAEVQALIPHEESWLLAALGLDAPLTTPEA
jgi:hypothetical protein